MSKSNTPVDEAKTSGFINSFEQSVRLRSNRQSVLSHSIANKWPELDECFIANLWIRRDVRIFQFFGGSKHAKQLWTSSINWNQQHDASAIDHQAQAMNHSSPSKKQHILTLLWSWLLATVSRLHLYWWTTLPTSQNNHVIKFLTPNRQLKLVQVSTLPHRASVMWRMTTTVRKKTKKKKLDFGQMRKSQLRPEITSSFSMKRFTR